MPALADLPEIVGFFGYSRDDYQDSEGALTTLRRQMQNELRTQLGRTGDTLRVWQDAEAISPGTYWNSQMKAAFKQAEFFIPIVTPRVIASRYCGMEFQRFLAEKKTRSRRLGFPIIYVEVDDLKHGDRWRGHRVLTVIAERQFVDWSEYRHEPDTVKVRQLII
jgi:hypothetical protein